MWTTIWTAVAAVSAFAYLIVFVVSVVILIRQWRVSAFVAMTERLQREEVRKARRAVISLAQPFSEWSKEEQQMAEVVCHTFDSVGQMVKRKLISEEMVTDEWGDSLRRCWTILKPFVEYRRAKTRWQWAWDDFQQLGEAACRRYGMPSPVCDANYRHTDIVETR